jgi:hypothetical protein
MRRSRIRALAYRSLAVLLVVFGALDLVAIGAPFLLTGVAMLLVGRRRRDRATLWPALIGVWSFVAGYVVVAPLGCSTSAGPVAADRASAGWTSCSNVLGIAYRGAGGYRAPLVPALLVGIATGVVAAVAARRLMRPSRAVGPRRV